MILSARGVLLLLLYLGSVVFEVKAQCPSILDGGGVPSASPVWVSCSGANYNLFVQPDDTLFNYSIDFGDGSPPATGDTLLEVNFVSYLYTVLDTNYTVTITANCGVITGTVILEITPSASIQIPVGSPTFGCAPATYAFENASTNVSQNTIFTWNWGDGSPIETYGDTNLGDTLYHEYLPGTVGCDVTITLTAQNNCPPTSINTYFPIQVWDFDEAEITADLILLCYPDTVVHFDNTTTRNCFGNGNTSQRYEYWNFGDYWGVGSDSIINWQPWSPPVRPGYDIAYPGIGSYTVMLIDSSFCGLDTAYMTINIVAQPIAGLSASPDTICEGETIIFSNLSTGATSYNWNFGDGSGWVPTGGGSQNHTYISSGTFTVDLVATIAGGSASCIDSASIQVVVLPGPQALFTENVNQGCDSLDVTFSEGSVGAVLWNWDFGNGDTSTAQNPPIISYSSVGSYIVNLAVEGSNGCRDSILRPIDIHETPSVDFIAVSVCVNELSQFNDASTTGADSIVSWFWDFGDGNTDTVQNPFHTYLAPGINVVTLTVSTNFCTATDSLAVLADTLPVSGFTSSIIDECTPLSVTFTNTSSGAATYMWYFGDGDSSAAFDTSHIFINGTASDTTYNVLLVSITGSGCSDSSFQSITVHPAPVASYTSNAAPGCSPVVVDFTNTSVGGTQYFWDFGDGNIDTINASPTHSFINNSNFILVDTVTLIVTTAFGCSDTVSSLVTIYPSANTVIAIPDTGCSPMTVNFSSTLTGAVIFDWDFGDGFTDSVPTPVHTYINPSINDTTYTVTLIVTSGFLCVDTSTRDIYIYAKPQSIFSVDSTVGCSGLTSNFSNTSVGAVNYFWDFGDGDTSTTGASNFSHVYTNITGTTATYNAQLIVQSSSNCWDTSTVPILIYSQVFSGFLQSDTMGCSPLSVSFTNTSSFADSYVWDFGDGSTLNTSASPTHSFSNAGPGDTTYTVTLIANSINGCSDTDTSFVTVYPQPTAGLIATPLSQVYPNTTVSIANLSSWFWNFSWDFGDGSTDTVQNPNTHTYATWGVYPIELIVYSANCSDTAVFTITILQPPPISDYQLTNSSGCRELTVIFDDMSLYADSLMWDFGDGTPFYFTTDTAPITHTYYNAGSYAVSLTAFGFGGPPNIKTALVEVYELPNAAFALNPNPTIVYLPDKAVYCVNLSTNAVSYNWDFGDGTGSTESSPSHIYTSTGSYDITLIATSAEGCIDTIIKPAAVIVEEGGTIIFPTAFTPDPVGGSDGVYDPNNFNNNIFHPFWDGVETYLLRVYNRWGELLFETEDVNVGWDGYYRGRMCQQDVYVWKATALFYSGETRTMAGDVTLLR